MWNITPNDIQRAKEELKGRRAAIEARYAADIKTLDTDFAEIETLEQAAAAFAFKHLADTAAAAEPAIADAHGSGAEVKSASRWRLRLGEHAAENEQA